jgi:hypothetical protein
MPVTVPVASHSSYCLLPVTVSVASQFLLPGTVPVASHSSCCLLPVTVLVARCQWQFLLPVTVPIACFQSQFLLPVKVSVVSHSFCCQSQFLLPVVSHSSCFQSQFLLPVTVPVARHSFCCHSQFLLPVASHSFSCHLQVLLHVASHSYCCQSQFLLPVAPRNWLFVLCTVWVLWDRSYCSCAQHWVAEHGVRTRVKWLPMSFHPTPSLTFHLMKNSVAASHFQILLLSQHFLADPEVCMQSFLDAFAKLQKATISFVMSACPYGTTRLPLDEFWWKLIFETFSKICRENSNFMTSYTKTGTLHKDFSTFLTISC